MSLTNSNDIVAYSVSLISANVVFWFILKETEAVDGSVGIPSDTLYNCVIIQLSNKANSADVCTQFQACTQTFIKENATLKKF